MSRGNIAFLVLFCFVFLSQQDHSDLALFASCRRGRRLLVFEFEVGGFATTSLWFRLNQISDYFGVIRLID